MSSANAHLISYALMMPNGTYTYHNEVTKGSPAAWLMGARKKAPNIVLLQANPMNDRDVALVRQEGWTINDEKQAA